MSSPSIVLPSLDEVDVEQAMRQTRETLQEMRQDFEEMHAEFSENPPSNNPFYFAQPDDETVASNAFEEESLSKQKRSDWADLKKELEKISEENRHFERRKSAQEVLVELSTIS